MVSDASQLRAIDVALSLARGRAKKLTPADLQIFERDMEAIRAAQRFSGSAVMDALEKYRALCAAKRPQALVLGMARVPEMASSRLRALDMHK